MSKTAFRFAVKTTRNAARPSPAVRQRRYQSTSASSSQSTSGPSLSHGLLGGLAGGGLVFISGYAYYHFSGAKTLVSTARRTEQTLKSYAEQFKSSSPDFEPNQAIEWLRSTAKSYGAIIPGASGYIDSAFNDIDAIRHKHGKEVDSILKEAYTELKEISNEGVTLATTQKSWDALEKHLKRITELAGDAGQDLLNNHPALKEKVGGNMDQLKQMGEKYGPEAQKQVDETIDQVKEIVKSGMRADTIPKIESLLQEKVQKVQEMGGKMWEQGMEKAQPLLAKSPQVKQVVNDNWDALKGSGNVQELYQKIKGAVSSGNADALKQYVEKVKQGSSGGGGGGGSGLESYLEMIPNGGQIIPKLTQMRQLAQEHGEEAEKIAKDTFKEIEEVLKRKVGEAEKLGRKAKDQ